MHSRFNNLARLVSQFLTGVGLGCVNFRTKEVGRGERWAQRDGIRHALVRSMAEPLLNHLFHVSISGDKYDQGFSFAAVSASQISEEIEIVDGKRRARGASGVDRLRLEYPVGSPAMKNFNTWFKNICNSRREIAKRTIDIELNREDGSKSGFIRLRNAWPCKVGLSTISQMGQSKAPLEYVELAYEGIDRSPEEREAKFGDKTPPRPKGPPPADNVLAGVASQKTHEMGSQAFRASENTPLGKAAWKEAMKQPPKNANLAEIRQGYTKEVANIKNVAAEQRAHGWKKSDVATDSCQLRRQIGLKYKNMTPEAERMGVYKRNWDKYGDPLGQTPKTMRARGEKWNEITEASTRTNRSVNMNLGVKP